MPVPGVQRGNYGDLFGSTMLPVLEELFRTQFEEQPMLRESIFKTVPWDRDIYQTSELHDMPLFQQVSEGQDYVFQAPKAGNHKTLVVNKYGLGYSISEETVDDGKFDLIADAIRKMGDSAHETQEQAAMNIFNTGFTSQTTADGLSLFNTAHTTPSGVYTVSNRLPQGTALSYSSLQQAIQNFGTNFRGDSGIYKLIRPKYLVVPMALKLYAKELIGSELKADSADNNMNSVKGEGMQVLVSPRLTDSASWFITADSKDTGLRIINRKPLETKAAASDSVGFLNDSILYKARYREVIDTTNAFGVFGNSSVN